MSHPVDLKEFVAGFVLEADEHLHSIHKNLVATSEALKLRHPEPRAIREMFRSFHTIKGLASMVQAEPIVDLTHEMESILRTADRAGGRLEEVALDLLLLGTQAVEERVQSISKVGIQGLAQAPAQLLKALSALQDTQSKQDIPSQIELSVPKEIQKSLSLADCEQLRQAIQKKKRAVLVEFKPSASRATRGINITSVRSALSQLGELVKVVPRACAQAPNGITFCLLFITHAKNTEITQAMGISEQEMISDISEVISKNDQANPPQPPEQTERSDASPLDFDPNLQLASQDRSSIRVDIRKLDETLERLSELLVTRSKLERATLELQASGVDVRKLSSVLGENSRQLKRLQSAVTATRMVPLSELLQRLPLITRSLTKTVDKAIHLNVQAGSLEVDKSVGDKVMPAILHLVRNAIDHAIETKSERRKLGKPETGTVSIICNGISGTSLTLSIQDDGRGIDKDAVARKMAGKKAKDFDELLEQISTPGLSTRDDVTHLSGRGMGMDIVKRTAEILGGSLTLKTDLGKGTLFTLKIPVSVTIVDVLSFMAGEQTFAAPLAMVDEIIALEPSQSVRVPTPVKNGPAIRMINRRGQAIPLIILDDLLNGRTEQSQKQERITPLSSKALIVNQHRGAIAFGVDRMIGQQEVVVRPLNDNLVRVNGMTGATDLGDGQPTLVLDLIGLGFMSLKKIETNK